MLLVVGWVNDIVSFGGGEGELAALTYLKVSISSIISKTSHAPFLQ